jgi:ribosomal protein L40E
MVKTLCRDCGAVALSAAAAERCGDCGSPRLVSHAALDTLAFAPTTSRPPKNANGPISPIVP